MRIRIHSPGQEPEPPFCLEPESAPGPWTSGAAQKSVILYVLYKCIQKCSQDGVGTSPGATKIVGKKGAALQDWAEEEKIFSSLTQLTKYFSGANIF